MARWENVELDASRDRGQWDTWGVQDAEISDGWLLLHLRKRRIYAPLAHPELPHQFARTALRHRTLTAFVSHYGRLGWHELTERQSNQLRFSGSGSWLKSKFEEHLSLLDKLDARSALGAYAEPLEWIRAHAETVGWCLQAGFELREKSGRRLEVVCERLIEQLPSQVGWRPTIGKTPEALLQRRNRTAIDVVGGLMQTYLSTNLEGVRRRIQYRDGSLYSMWGGETLIESIYTLVSNAVTGGRLSQCESCGAVFLKTDERQRFCPKREGQAKSPCMNRERVQRQRHKSTGEKEKTSGGKAKRARRR